MVLLTVSYFLHSDLSAIIIFTIMGLCYMVSACDVLNCMAFKPTSHLVTRVGYAYLQSSFRVSDWQRRNGWPTLDLECFSKPMSQIPVREIQLSRAALLRNLLAPKKLKS